MNPQHLQYEFGWDAQLDGIPVAGDADGEIRHPKYRAGVLENDQWVLKLKKPGRLYRTCQVAGCPTPRPLAARHWKQWICSPHWRESWAMKNPLHPFLDQLKLRAKRKGLSCALTVDILQQLLDSVDLPAELLMGRNYSVDRIDFNRGYEIDNIQFVSHRDNAARRRGHVANVEWIGERFVYRDPVYKPDPNLIFDEV